MVPFFILFALTIYKVDSQNYTTPPKIDPFLNQTAYGWFGIMKGGVFVQNYSSKWMQDNVAQKLYLNIGVRGTADYMADYYFFKDVTYELRSGSDDCIMLPDFNYSMEIKAYGPQHVSYLGEATLPYAPSEALNMYAGTVLDGVGKLNVVLFTDKETNRQYKGLMAVGVYGKFDYNLYYFPPGGISNAVPDASEFALPKECASPKVEYFWDKWNPDGTPKKKPASATATTSMWATAMVASVLCYVCSNAD